MASSRPSSDLAAFRKLLASAKSVVVLTGAGVSAESGVPTFRGAGGFWRQYQAQDLATPGAFYRDPSLVWEFYHYRREVMLSKSPNPAHLAIAECAERLKGEGRRLRVITQNIDELHTTAGTKNLLELHGSLFRVRCIDCGEVILEGTGLPIKITPFLLRSFRALKVTENKDSPICKALEGRGAPDPDAQAARIPEKDLPRCQKPTCGGLLRPHVVWFGENLDEQVLDTAQEELESCDLCLVVGTSSVVYPAAMFAPQVASRGIPVAEFNMETTPATRRLGKHGFYFEGPCGTTLPPALAP